VIHDQSHQLLAAGAALDDLEPTERLAYDEHRATCPDCRRLDQELDLVLADLALSVPERMPPPDLLLGIRMAIAEDTPLPAGITSLAAERVRRRPGFAAIGLAAAFAIMAVGLGARTVSLGNDLDRSQAQLTALQSEVSSQGAVMAVAVDPRHVSATLHAEPVAPTAAAVVMYVPGTSEAWLVAHNLPATPAGQAYQLWYADGAGVHPLGTATWAGSGTFVASFNVDLANSAAVMVTLEPAGGATGAPGPQVVFGELHQGA
jgi:anti-sigma-K factor RskA